MCRARGLGLPREAGALPHASCAQGDKVSDVGQLVPSFTVWRGSVA
jgi:hypothetical protein